MSLFPCGELERFCSATLSRRHIYPTRAKKPVYRATDEPLFALSIRDTLLMERAGDLVLGEARVLWRRCLLGQIASSGAKNSHVVSEGVEFVASRMTAGSSVDLVGKNNCGAVGMNGVVFIGS